ncbi:hypothetical protein [Kochikohdavirus PBEF19]|uniref:Uncharacterized protein n=1 Tax=Enterococcus phage PBEF129 TaxID=2696337 RepID=A0A7T3JEQ9_9CAUD|nr:hypothetical protein [Enterococcus phage PBEF129]
MLISLPSSLIVKTFLETALASNCKENVFLSGKPTSPRYSPSTTPCVFPKVIGYFIIPPRGLMNKPYCLGSNDVFIPVEITFEPNLPGITTPSSAVNKSCATSFSLPRFGFLAPSRIVYFTTAPSGTNR